MYIYIYILEFFSNNGKLKLLKNYIYIYIYSIHIIWFLLKSLSNSMNYIYTDWWFGTFFIFSIYWEFHHPNWLFFRGWLNHQPVYFGQWWFNQSQIRTMVVYLPTKLDVWGKCWDSYSNTMVRIWGSSTTNQINYLYIIYIYLVAHPTARKWVITVIYMG